MTDPYEAAARYRAERDQARQELAKLRDRSRDTTVSAYDLLPQEDREALRWVREHGGIAEVEKRLMPEGCEWPRYYADTVPRSCMEKRLARRQRQVDESHAALRRRNRWIAELEHLLCKEMSYSLRRDAGCLTPEALDADGVEIREGETVYGVEDGMKYEVCEAKLPRVTVEYWCAGISAHSSIVPSLLTHRAPVLAADGKPLREGETVWSVDSGTRYTVEKITDELIPIKCRSEMGSTVSLCPSQLAHERPDTRALVIDGMDEETVERIDRLVKDGRWLDD